MQFELFQVWLRCEPEYRKNVSADQYCLDQHKQVVQTDAYSKNLMYSNSNGCKIKFSTAGYMLNGITIKGCTMKGSKITEVFVRIKN